MKVKPGSKMDKAMEKKAGVKPGSKADKKMEMTGKMPMMSQKQMGKMMKGKK